MRLGLGEWGFRELPFEEHCRIAREMGFRYLELGIGGDFAGRLSRGMTEAEVRAVRDCVRDYGLTAPWVCLENDFTLDSAEEHRTMVERTREEIGLCRQLGATHVRLFAGFAPLSEMDETRWERMLAAFRDISGLCAPHGIAIAVETHGRLTALGGGFAHEHTVTTDWTSLQRLLAELPGNIGFNFDPGNLKPLADRPLREYARLLGERINYCHLKDWKRVGQAWAACGVGDDDLDWDELLQATTYDGVYLIEYEPVHDVADGIARSLAHLRRIRPDASL